MEQREVDQMQTIQRTFAFSSVIFIGLLVGCQREEEKLPQVSAAKCADADNDGICNTSDVCPDTKPGTRVGPVGCNCDYTLHTHFANDSSNLVVAEDKAELDRLAEVMLNPRLRFVAGEI